MLAFADTAVYLFIPQLILNALLLSLFGLVLAILLPCHARPEHDVLTHRRGVEAGTRRVVFLETKLGPCSSLGHARVDSLANDSGTNATCCFDLFAFVVDRVGDNRLGAIFVGCYGLWW